MDPRREGGRRRDCVVRSPVCQSPSHAEATAVSHGRSYTGHPRAHVGFSHARPPPQHVRPPCPQFPLPGGPFIGTRSRDAHTTAAVTHLVTPAPWHSHTQPTLLTREGPSSVLLPTRHLHSDVSQSREVELITSPQILDITALFCPYIQRSPSSFPLSPKPLACHLSPSSGSSVQPVTPPPVPVLSHLFKMQIWSCHSLLNPSVASCALRVKPASSALAPEKTPSPSPLWLSLLKSLAPAVSLSLFLELFAHPILSSERPVFTPSCTPPALHPSSQQDS